MLEKVKQGYACLVEWDDIKDNPPPHLKISTVAAIPHKSRMYCTILDLSYQLLVAGIPLPRVNAATTKLAPAQSMKELGNVLPRLIATVAEATPTTDHIFFAKWDIKDGFWRMVVSKNEAWNFCYVLPARPNEKIMIVCPDSLPMGWCESPPLFGSASETARDVAQSLLDNTATALPAHPLEHYSIPTPLQLPPAHDITPHKLKKLLEVYVDDFVGLIQAPNLEQLQWFTRAILHGIHSIFPPQDDQNIMEEPIAIKKLKQGEGCWNTQKEILGWLFNGITRCISLPTDKVNKLLSTLQTTAKRASIPVKDLEKLQGRLIHASYGIPAGRGLLSPIIATVTKHKITKKTGPASMLKPDKHYKTGALYSGQPQHNPHYAQIWSQQLQILGVTVTPQNREQEVYGLAYKPVCHQSSGV